MKDPDIAIVRQGGRSVYVQDQELAHEKTSLQYSCRKKTERSSPSFGLRCLATLFASAYLGRFGICAWQYFLEVDLEDDSS